MSPSKTKIVYCKDRERTEAYPEISFDFLGYTFTVSKEGELSVNFLPAMSARAAKAIRQTVRGWDLSHKTPLSLEVMARWLNPMLRGWIKYYGRFYRSAMDCIASHVAKRTISAGINVSNFTRRLLLSIDCIKINQHASTHPFSINAAQPNNIDGIMQAFERVSDKGHRWNTQ
jgi:hypothetical protein